MSTFFRQTAQAMIAKHIDRFPLLKLDQVIDWQPIEQYLNRQKNRYLRDHRGRPAYPLLSMFKAVLLGQWHSLSDPELEHSLITRIDFNLFCRFDELIIPDYSTLCRYRNWLAQDDTLSELLKLINCQLTEKGLKIEKASAAVVDATIIQTAGSKQRQAIEVDEEGQISGQTTPSKDSDARWIKKNGLYKLGYKQHTRTDAERLYRETAHHPANAHRVQTPAAFVGRTAQRYDRLCRQRLRQCRKPATSGRTSVAGRHYAQNLPQPSAVGGANQTQPVFVEDPLCG
ncbi:transposase DDE domain protein [Neisseria meningitidis 2002038]|nr:transposase DDE domain protein [Neisseria meningitidis 2002038]